MKKTNLYHVLAIVFLLMMSAITYAGTSMAHFGFVDAIEDSQKNKGDLKILHVSGKEYFFNRDAVKVIYKDVYVNISDLAKGMKVKFHTSGSSAKITEITILSTHENLIDH